MKAIVREGRSPTSQPGRLPCASSLSRAFSLCTSSIISVETGRATGVVEGRRVAAPFLCGDCAGAPSFDDEGLRPTLLDGCLLGVTRVGGSPAARSLATHEPPIPLCLRQTSPHCAVGEA
eukprot:scaffold257831_cov31-Tisochrysis_lutea.AAC.9